MTKDLNKKNDDDTEFNIKTLQDEPYKEVKKLASMLDGNKEFEAGLEAIFASIEKGGFDLSKIQSQIVLLIESALKNITSKKEDLKKTSELLKQKHDIIFKHLTELSLLLIIEPAREDTKPKIHADDNIDHPKDVDRLFKSSMTTNLRRLIRRFVTYEIYKIMTPRRIAGETKRDNFLSNNTFRGLETALHNEGGSLGAQPKYSADLLKDIQNIQCNTDRLSNEGNIKKDTANPQSKSITKSLSLYNQ